MKLVPNTVTRSLATSVLKTKANSPHLFFAAGVVGVVGATVMACRATLKLQPTLDQIEKDVEDVKTVTTEMEHSDQEKARAMGLVYGKSGLEIVKLYAPAAAVGVVSIGLLTGSHIQLVHRNAALTTTVGLAMKAHNEYRERVRRELGVDRELDLHHAIQSKVITEPDGSKHVVKIADPNKFSQYARFFDETASAWEKDAEMNSLYVKLAQNYFNARLQVKGHIFLNEVYDHFGIERSPEGQIVGWVIGGDGDNYIDFGVFEAHNRDFVHGQERSILLDFNVDGPILNLI